MGVKWSFEIMTDSTANLPGNLIREQKLSILSLTYMAGGVEYKGYEEGKERSAVSVYRMMRDKVEIRTSLVNGQEVHCLTEELLRQGKDILYIGLSSGLSGTYQVVWSVFQELQEEYPDRRLIAVDSLSAALGEGLLVRHAVQMRDAGRSLDEISGWLQANCRYVCHEFTVEDLFHLKRGGRIGTAAAVLGSALKVKPLLRLDREGQLVAAGRARGRKKSFDALVERMEQNIVQPEKQIVYINHGDCSEAAEYLAEQIRQRIHVRGVQTELLEPVIGSHTGPGTAGIFYIGRSR